MVLKICDYLENDAIKRLSDALQKQAKVERKRKHSERMYSVLRSARCFNPEMVAVLLRSRTLLTFEALTQLEAMVKRQAKSAKLAVYRQPAVPNNPVKGILLLTDLVIPIGPQWKRGNFEWTEPNKMVIGGGIIRRTDGRRIDVMLSGFTPTINGYLFQMEEAIFSKIDYVVVYFETPRLGEFPPELTLQKIIQKCHYLQKPCIVIAPRIAREPFVEAVRRLLRFYHLHTLFLSDPVFFKEVEVRTFKRSYRFIPSVTMIVSELFDIVYTLSPKIKPK